jgi:Skp family chaperone for outer membrane proteins
MDRPSPTSAAWFATLVLALFLFSPSGSLAESDVKIAVVDMQQVLNRYDQTQVEVGAMNQRTEEMTKEADEMKSKLKRLTDQMVELQKEAADTALPEKERKEAAEAFQVQARERNNLLKEIADYESEAAQSIAKERSKMEMRLVSVIDKMIETIAEEKQIDIVWDSSFLPKGNKAIKYTSSRVTDLTDEIVQRLND